MKEKIEQLFKKGNELYQQIKSSTEEKVVEWYWSKGAAEKYEPFYNEEHNYPKARRLKEQPKDKKYHTQCGLDSFGNIIIKREYNEIGFYETFFQIEKDKVISFHFDYNPTKKSIINCTLYLLNNGITEEIYCSAIRGISHTKYYYENKLLTSKENIHYNRETKESTTKTIIYEYDDKNIIIGIRSGNYYLYQRKTKLNFTQLKTEAEKRSIEILKNHIKKYAPKEKIFTINLTYNPQFYFLPTIAFGLESERENFIKKYKNEARYYIWNCAEYEWIYDDIDLSKSNAHLFDELNQEISIQEKNNLAVKSIIAIAISLKESISEFNLNITEDFTIVATDYELVDFKKNFKKINPEKWDNFKNILP